MPLFFNISEENVHPRIWNELKAENKRVYAVVNEIISFCNERLRKESKLDKLEEDDFIWKDSNLLPKNSRISTMKMAAKFNGQVYQRSAIATSLGPKLQKLSIQKRGASCQEKNNKGNSRPWWPNNFRFTGKNCYRSGSSTGRTRGVLTESIFK